MKKNSNQISKWWNKCASLKLEPAYISMMWNENKIGSPGYRQRLLRIPPKPVLWLHSIQSSNWTNAEELLFTPTRKMKLKYQAKKKRFDNGILYFVFIIFFFIIFRIKRFYKLITLWYSWIMLNKFDRFGGKFVLVGGVGFFFEVQGWGLWAGTFYWICEIFVKGFGVFFFIFTIVGCKGVLTSMIF